MSELDLDALEATARAAEKVAPGEWLASASVVQCRDDNTDDGWLNGIATTNPLDDFARDDEGALAAHIADFDPPTVLHLISEARRVKGLEEALRPFAQIAPKWDVDDNWIDATGDQPWADDDTVCLADGNSTLDQELSVGDFRRARSALSDQSGCEATS